MAREKREKSVVGTWYPAVREVVGGVARTADEIKKLREDGKVDGVLFVGEKSPTLQNAINSLKPIVAQYVASASKVAPAAKGKEAQLLNELAEVLSGTSWQLPIREAAKIAKAEPNSVEF